MVVTPAGAIFSGHSIDRATAEKTAHNDASLRSGYRLHWNTRRTPSVAAYAYMATVARAEGFATPKAYEADCAAKRAAFVAACKIEIVDL
jgi:uncharacterized protein (DUF924 family)